MYATTRRWVLGAVGIGGALNCRVFVNLGQDQGAQSTPASSDAASTSIDTDRIAADPTAVSDPIMRNEPTTHEITFSTEEVTAEIEPGVTFDYMTFDGQVPGPMSRVRQGDTVRVFLVVGGPNVSSNFHPIGNVWSRAYRDRGIPEDGSLDEYAEKNIQTMKVPPGSRMIGEMETPVTSRIKIVDHALSRVVRKGMLTEIDVDGEGGTSIYDPGFRGSSHSDPMYSSHRPGTRLSSALHYSLSTGTTLSR